MDNTLPGSVKLFISFSHDSPAHEDRVLDLANRLLEDGIEAIIDLYETSPPEGWPRWMDKQIRDADFVAMVCTETYYRRVMGEEEHGKGLGVRWEGNIIYNHFYVDEVLNTKFIPLLVDGFDISHVPRPFQGATYYRIDTEDGYKQFYRRITNQPLDPRPTRGKLKSFPPRQRKSSFRGVTNLPPRNPFFTGRDQVLIDLRAALTRDSTTAITEAISGLGGIGKTQTAVEYGHRHLNDYKATLFVRAEKRDEIISGFSEIAERLDLPEKDAQNLDDKARAVIRWLEANDTWLLIFDNADDPGMLKPFLPCNHRGHILLSSRAQVFHEIGVVKPVELESMLPDDALRFLFTRTGRDINNRPEKEAAEQLAKELGYLPLALEQSGAFITENKVRFQDYLTSFRRRRMELLNEAKPITGDYPESVATAWSLNFEAVEKISEASADLLRISAFLSPDQIPFELIVKGKKELSPALAAAFADAEDDPLRISRLLKPLTQYSLIHVDPDSRTYGIHRLVQEVLKGRMDQETCRRWAEQTVRGLNQAFPYIEFANWTLCERLLPHAIVAAQLIEEYEFEFTEGARLLNQTGVYYYHRAQYVAALSLYELALAIWEKSRGADHPDVASILNNLAELYRAQGKYEAALPLYERALAIREKSLGAEHPDAATSLNNLALLYYAEGKYEAALPLYEQSLTILEKSQGPDHPDVAANLNNLAGLYSAQGKYEAALPLYERALAIKEKSLGAEHPGVATSLNNLAALYRALGKYEAALPLYERAREIWEKSLGPDHPNVATVLENYAFLLRAMNRHEKANEFYARAKAIRARHAQENPS